MELAAIPARDLLDANDVGAVPWVTLAHIDGPPEPIFRLCKERIEREASPAEKENLITVSMVLASSDMMILASWNCLEGMPP